MPRPRRVGRPHPAGAGASARYGAGLGIARFQEAAYKYIMEGFESQAQISRRDPGGRDLHSCKRVRTISNVLSDESGWAFSRRHAGRRVAVGPGDWTAVWAGEERSEGPVTCKAHFAAALLPHFSAKSESDSALFSCAGESNLPVYHGAACEGAWAACMCIVHWPGWKGL